jgi:hypothetical protein
MYADDFKKRQQSTIQTDNCWKLTKIITRKNVQEADFTDGNNERIVSSGYGERKKGEIVVDDDPAARKVATS